VVINWQGWQMERADKRRVIARMIMSDVLSFGHCHVIDPDGHWCATLAPAELARAGPLLYVRLPDLPTGVEASLVIYDEAF
jgi:hypothetical protein